MEAAVSESRAKLRAIFANRYFIFRHAVDGRAEGKRCPLRPPATCATVLFFMLMAFFIGV
jgi:hypothetical protein